MAGANEKVDAYYRAVANGFASKVQDALKMIGEPSLELLALRRYVRKEKDLDAQWVWSAQQIKDYERSPEFARTKVEIEKVKKKFEDSNPGYTLAASPIRDLKKQVRLWKGNKTVHAAAKDVKRRCVQEIGRYPDSPDFHATEKFRSFLEICNVDPEPTSAAPGLSDHGQMHAIDFVVVKDGETIAGTSTATIQSRWDAPGWTQKLNDAVTQSGSLFVGPLKHPREPWHYTLPHTRKRKRSG